MTEPNKWSRPSHGFLTVTKVLLASNILFSSFASKKDANVANRRTGKLFTDGIMSDHLSASQHAAKNLRGWAHSGLSAGELRRRHELSEEVNQGLKEIEFVVEKVDGGIMLKATSELSCLLLNAPMSWPVEPKDAGTVEAAVRCGFDFQSLKCGHVKKTIGETLIDGLQVSATVIADKATVSDIANSVITPGSKAELSSHSLSMLRNQSMSLNLDSSHDLMTYLSKTKVLPLGMPGKWIHSFLKLGPGCIVGDSPLYGSTFPAPPNPLFTQEKVKEYYHLVRTVITGIRSVQFASKELEWVWTLSFSNFNPFCILPDVNDGNVQKYRKGGRLEKEFAELVKLGEKFNRQA